MRGIMMGMEVSIAKATLNKFARIGAPGFGNGMRGAKRSDTRWYREHLQRSRPPRAGEPAASDLSSVALKLRIRIRSFCAPDQRRRQSIGEVTYLFILPMCCALSRRTKQSTPAPFSLAAFEHHVHHAAHHDDTARNQD